MNNLTVFIFTASILTLMAMAQARADVAFTANQSYIDIYSASEEESDPYRYDDDIFYADGYLLPEAIPGTIDESAAVSSSAGPDSSSADASMTAQFSAPVGAIAVAGSVVLNAAASSNETPGYDTYANGLIALSLEFAIDGPYDFTFSASQNADAWSYAHGFIEDMSGSQPDILLFGIGTDAGYSSNTFNDNINGRLEIGTYTLTVIAYSEAIPDETHSAGGNYNFTLTSAAPDNLVSVDEDVPIPVLAHLLLALSLLGIGAWKTRG